VCGGIAVAVPAAAAPADATDQGDVGDSEVVNGPVEPIPWPEDHMETECVDEVEEGVDGLVVWPAPGSSVIDRRHRDHAESVASLHQWWRRGMRQRALEAPLVWHRLSWQISDCSTIADDNASVDTISSVGSYECFESRGAHLISL